MFSLLRNLKLKVIVGAALVASILLNFFSFKRNSKLKKKISNVESEKRKVTNDAKIIIDQDRKLSEALNEITSNDNNDRDYFDK